MERKCDVCGGDFEAARSTARYCSDRCRKLAFQKTEVSVPENGKTGVSVPKTLSVPVSVPDKMEIACQEMRDGIWIDVEKDLGLDLKKDLGCRGWDENGVHVLPSITVEQVRNIARLVHARHGRDCPVFRT